MNDSNEKQIKLENTSEIEQLETKIKELQGPMNELRKPIVVYLGCGCKGGIGKTTISVNVANTIKKLYPDKKTLLIDYDQQANASTLANVNTENQMNEYNDIGSYCYELIMKNKAIMKEDVEKLIYTPKFERRVQKQGSIQWETLEESYNFDIIPSSISLSLVEMMFFRSTLQMTDEKKENLLKRIINVIKKHFDYDFILIDGSPAMGVFMSNCLNASDYVITPTTLVYTSLVGVNYVLELISAMTKTQGLKARWLGIIISNAKLRSGSEKMNKEELFNRFGEEAIFQTEITSTADNENATISEQILSNFNKRSEYQFKCVTLELLERILKAEGKVK